MYRDVDEEGEPTYDPDSQSREGSPEEEEEEEEEWQDSPSASPSPAVESYDRSPKAKPRKRLVKKSNAVEQLPESEPEEDDEDRPRKRKSKDFEEGDGRKRIRKVKDGRESRDRDTRESSKKGKSGSTSSKLAKLARNNGGGRSERATVSDRPLSRTERRAEKSPWEDPKAAAENSEEEDKEVEPTPEDDNFIDDTGVERYSDYEGEYATGSPSNAPEAEEAEEEDPDDINKFFKSGRKKSTTERTSEEIAMFVEQFMAKLDVAAEADADLNRASKPAIEKLKMLPELLNVLEKRQLQQEFLDRGVLSSLKNWLEPLPDGSLPNMNIRSALLKLLTDLPIDVEVFERREQLKKSGLGKVVMFLSRLSEETPANKKLARDLVDKWSRPIFQKSTRYEDLRQYDDERPLPRRPPVKKPVPKPSMESRGGDELELENDPEELKPGDPGYRYHASRPQALPLDFVVRPASKVDAESVRAHAKQQRLDEKRMKMNKKLQQLRTPKKKNLQAARLSVEGRGLVKFY